MFEIEYFCTPGILWYIYCRRARISAMMIKALNIAEGKYQKHNYLKVV